MNQDRKTNLLVRYLEEVLTGKFAFKIYWPLEHTVDIRGWLEVIKLTWTKFYPILTPNPPEQTKKDIGLFNDPLPPPTSSFPRSYWMIHYGLFSWPLWTKICNNSVLFYFSDWPSNQLTKTEALSGSQHVVLWLTRTSMSDMPSVPSLKNLVQSSLFGENSNNGGRSGQRSRWEKLL